MSYHRQIRITRDLSRRQGRLLRRLVSQATERSYVHHPPAWLRDWCKACAFTHTIPRAYAACDSFGMCSGRLETREATRSFNLINGYLPNTFGTLGSVETGNILIVQSHCSMYAVQNSSQERPGTIGGGSTVELLHPCKLYPAAYKKIPGCSRSADSKVLLALWTLGYRLNWWRDEQALPGIIVIR